MKGDVRGLTNTFVCLFVNLTLTLTLTLTHFQNLTLTLNHSYQAPSDPSPKILPRNFPPINSLQTFHVSTFSTNQISRKFDPFPRFPRFHFSLQKHHTHSQTTLSPLFSREDFISTIRFTPSPLLTPHFTTHSLHSSTTHPHHYHLTSTTTTLITTSHYPTTLTLQPTIQQTLTTSTTTQPLIPLTRLKTNTPYPFQLLTP